MDEFKKLQSELSKVDNLSELSRHCGISRDHLRRIRDGGVSNTTLSTLVQIRAGIQQMQSARAA